MWLPNDIIASVDRVARIEYVDANTCLSWNRHRRDGELRLLTGWAWTERGSSHQRQGFKTMTVAYRDAYYALVRKSASPSLTRARLRVVS